MNGKNLSSGEKQLLAIIRVFIYPCKLIILDEASAHIDTQTEAFLQQAIKILLKEKTTIVIAHRLSTIRQSDKILVIKDGKTQEEGHHSQLMKTQNIYSQMFKAQKL